MKKVKRIITKAKQNYLIQPHVLAFDTNPVDLEEHKGNLDNYELESKILEAEKEMENNPKFYTSEEVLESMRKCIEE